MHSRNVRAMYGIVNVPVALLNRVNSYKGNDFNKILHLAQYIQILSLQHVANVKENDF